MAVIKLQNDISTNLRDIILFVESYLLKNKYLRFGVKLNERRLGANTRYSRKKAGFDLLYHIQHQDIYGKTEGCGCLYCQVHFQYVKYHTIYKNIKRRFDKLQLITEKPELLQQILEQGKDTNLPHYAFLPNGTTLNPVVVEGYKKTLAAHREKYMKYKLLRKKVAKSFKIPRECR